MSGYDQRIHDAMMRLPDRATAAQVARELGRPVNARGMGASLKAAAGRVDWLEYRDGFWCFTKGERQRIGREQLAEELDAEERPSRALVYRATLFLDEEDRGPTSKTGPSAEFSSLDEARAWCEEEVGSRPAPEGAFWYGSLLRGHYVDPIGERLQGDIRFEADPEWGEDVFTPSPTPRSPR